MSCPYVRRRVEIPKQGAVVLCGCISDEAGFRVSVQESACDHCLGDQASAQFQQLLRGALASRLIAGDLPKYQTANPVDLAAAFAKHRAVAGEEATRGLLKRMIHAQKAIKPEEGGHAPEVLGEKLLNLAEAHGMVDALEEAIEEDLAARRPLEEKADGGGTGLSGGGSQEYDPSSPV